MDKNRILALGAITLLLATAFSLYLLNEDPLPEIRMTLLSDSVQEVGYEETAEYTINVRNVDGNSKNLPLTFTAVPEHWHASLDKDHLILSGNSQTTVTLSVTAPSVNAAGIRGLDTVAAIGIRGGNVTIGTITILKGTASVLRNGTVEDLGPGDDILSGDIVSSSGDAIITIDPSRLINNWKLYEGDIYVLLHDAVVGFLRYQDTAYMLIIRGEVSIWVPGGGSGGIRGDDRGWTASSLSINLSENAVLNAAFPRQDINAVIEFHEPPAEDYLFSLEITGEETRVEVFEGELEVTNDEESLVLVEYEQVTVGKTGEIPDPGRVLAIVMEIETDGTTEEVVEVDGRNIYEVEDAIAMSNMSGHSIYVIHPPDEETPGVTITQTGTTGKGEYITRFTSIDDVSTRSFEFSTSSTAGLRDKITISEDMITLDSEEEDKTYDLSIVYREKGEEEDIFTLSDVITSKEEQTTEVQDWANLTDDEVDSVTFTEGDVTVTAKNGDTGEELEVKIENIRERDKKADLTFFWVGLVSSLGIICFYFALLLLFSILGNVTIEDQISMTLILGFLLGKKETLEYNSGTIKLIANDLNMEKSEVKRHVEKLLKERRLDTEKIDSKEYICPPRHPFKPEDIGEKEKKIWRYINNNPWKNQKEIARGTHLSLLIAALGIYKLKTKGIVIIKRENYIKEPLHYAIEELPSSDEPE